MLWLQIVGLPGYWQSLELQQRAQFGSQLVALSGKYIREKLFKLDLVWQFHATITPRPQIYSTSDLYQATMKANHWRNPMRLKGEKLFHSLILIHFERTEVDWWNLFICLLVSLIVSEPKVFFFFHKDLWELAKTEFKASLTSSKFYYFALCLKLIKISPYKALSWVKVKVSKGF